MASLPRLWIIIAAVVAQIIGTIRYGPLFGRQYGDATGMDMSTKPAPSEMARLIITEFVSKIVFFASFAYIMNLVSEQAAGGVIVAFTLAALMVLVSQITRSTYKPSLYWIMGLGLLVMIAFACALWMWMY